MKKLTQSQLAKELGISKSYLSMILSGQRKASLEIINKLQSIKGFYLSYTQGVTGSNPVSPTICSHRVALKCCRTPYIM
ncbi:MAG: helix-turn-helix transcriptional regulator [Dehalococcoidia bacterium]